MSHDFGLRRFAVLHHAGGEDGPHYDFMFDTSDTSSLVTFRLPEWPLASGSAHAARKLRDHRRIYLTYEGQISGDRGHVSRVAEGDVYVHEIAGHRWLLCHPRQPPLLFEPVRDDEWRVICSEPLATPSPPPDASTPPDAADAPRS